MIMITYNENIIFVKKQCFYLSSNQGVREVPKILLVRIKYFLCKEEASYLQVEPKPVLVNPTSLHQSPKTETTKKYGSLSCAAKMT